MEIIPQGKRRFLRIKIKVPMRYQPIGRPESYNAVCDDISSGGLGFIDYRFIAPKTPLTFEMNLASRLISPAGKVAWVLALPHSDRFKIGVEFSNLNPKDEVYLKDCMDMHMGRL